MKFLTDPQDQHERSSRLSTLVDDIEEAIPSLVVARDALAGVDVDASKELNNALNSILDCLAYAVHPTSFSPSTKEEYSRVDGMRGNFPYLH